MLQKIQRKYQVHDKTNTKDDYICLFAVVWYVPIILPGNHASDYATLIGPTIPKQYQIILFRVRS